MSAMDLILHLDSWVGYRDKNAAVMDYSTWGCWERKVFKIGFQSTPGSPVFKCGVHRGGMGPPFHGIGEIKGGLLMSEEQLPPI